MNNLNDALNALNKNIEEFPLGIESIDDFKPCEEKIHEIKKLLKQANAKRLKLLSIHDRYTTTLVEEDIEKSVSDVRQETVNCLINNKAMELCIYGHAITHITSQDQPVSQIQVQVFNYLYKLFCLNDNCMFLKEKEQKLLEKETKLKIECKVAIHDYDEFLQQQKEKQEQYLKQTNPEIAIKKESLNVVIQKINVMKKLITNFLGATTSYLVKNTFYREMLEKHRELINEETIIQMSSQEHSP